MNRLRHEAGQTVVLFAVLLPLFLGLGAIAVDVGYWYVVQKTAQDAADAAALAAARELPDPCAAKAKGEEYGLANMPDAVIVVRPPTLCEFGGPGIETGAGTDLAADEVEARVFQETALFFGRIFGLLPPRVEAHAVAQRLGGHGNLAIFAFDSECNEYDPLDFDGRDVFVDGLVHDNGRFRVSSGPFWAAEGTHDKPNCPSSTDSMAESQFGEDMPPPRGTACAGSPCREPNDDVHQDWPVWFTPAKFGWRAGCTFAGDVIEIRAGLVKVDAQTYPMSGNQLLPGVYCAQDSFAMQGAGFTGSITALAPEISVDGRDHVLTAFANGVLFFAVPNTDEDVTNDGPPATSPVACEGTSMNLGGTAQSWSGIVFDPCGLVDVSAGGSTPDHPVLSGAILAARVRITGSDFYMAGHGDLTLPPHMFLVK
jgi:hypothetical protein